MYVTPVTPKIEIYSVFIEICTICTKKRYTGYKFLKKSLCIKKKE
nr:MAG TPA: hypothetical protein [Caudoviricetes sp.]